MVAEVPDNLIQLCPSCGSGDINWCAISNRPYCSDCHYWGGVNFGAGKDAVRSWNNRLLETVKFSPYSSFITKTYTEHMDPATLDFRDRLPSAKPEPVIEEAPQMPSTYSGIPITACSPLDVHCARIHGTLKFKVGDWDLYEYQGKYYLT
jgi:hypothetical protein